MTVPVAARVGGRMTVTVFGASGAIGRQVLEQALAAGYTVRAFVRDAAKSPTDARVTTVVGEITDADRVAEAVQGADAVIWAVGPSRNAADQVQVFESGAQNLVAAMKKHGVSRLVALSGAGVTVDGERKPLGGRLMSGLVSVVVRHVVEAKRREYGVFKTSGLEWTLVRPPRVVDGPPTGRYVAGGEETGSRVTQGDLAAFMVRELEERRYVKAAPFVHS